MPAAARRCPSRARIPSRGTPLRRRHSPKPALAHQASLPHQTRPTAEEELLCSAPVLQRRGDVPESHDAHHGLWWPDDARDALYHGKSSLFSSFRKTDAVHDLLAAENHGS